MAKRIVPGFLYNVKEGYKYPNGKSFDNEDEYNKAIDDGWDTGPVGKTKAKAKVKPKEEKKKEG